MRKLTIRIGSSYMGLHMYLLTAMCTFSTPHMRQEPSPCLRAAKGTARDMLLLTAICMTNELADLDGCVGGQ